MTPIRVTALTIEIVQRGEVRGTLSVSAAAPKKEAVLATR